MKRFPQIVVSLASVLAVLGADISLAQSGGGGRGMMQRFEALDENGDGQISASEAAEWRDTVFVTMDSDDDGKLTREEYMEVQLGQGADSDQRGPRYAERQAEKDAQYTVMDADKDGFVTKEQFMSNGQIQFSSADADKDGVVTMPEFIASHWM